MMMPANTTIHQNQDMSQEASQIAIGKVYFQFCKILLMRFLWKDGVVLFSSFSAAAIEELGEVVREAPAAVCWASPGAAAVLLDDDGSQLFNCELSVSWFIFSAAHDFAFSML